MAGVNLGGRKDWETIEVLASAARTATGSVEIGALGGPVEYLVFVTNVSAASGTSPTLEFDLEGTVDGTNWFKVDDLSSPSGSTGIRTRLTHSFSGFALVPRMRIRYIIGGTTPSFTFDVKIVAVTGG